MFVTHRVGGGLVLQRRTTTVKTTVFPHSFATVLLVESR